MTWNVPNLNYMFHFSDDEEDIITDTDADAYIETDYYQENEYLQESRYIQTNLIAQFN